MQPPTPVKPVKTPSHGMDEKQAKALCVAFFQSNPVRDLQQPASPNPHLNLNTLESLSCTPHVNPDATRHGAARGLLGAPGRSYVVPKRHRPTVRGILETSAMGIQRVLGDPGMWGS